MRRTARAVALFIVASAVVPVASAVAVLAAFLFLPLPASLPEAREGVTAQVSRIYDVHGDLIGTFERFDTVRPVAREDIPDVLKEAVVSAEDRRFYSHSGVDVQGTLRALWSDIRAGQVVEGGSTITQQYVKNTYVGNERSLSRKVREAVVASQLDRQVDKEEILFRYLSSVFFGDGAYGVGAAAETYFDKAVNDLSISEAALLAGLIPAPSRFQPRAHPEVAEVRRTQVLGQMLREDYITEAEHAEALAQEVWSFDVSGFPPEGQPITFIHPRRRVETAFPYFVDYVRRYMDVHYGEGAVYERGFEIYTTLDPGMQLVAEEAVRATLSGTDPPLEMALASVEPGSGYVKALVGGRDFNAPGGSVNLALGKDGGGTGRQPGSTYKPFVVAAALEAGIPPSKTYSGRSPVVISGHPFQNFGGSNFGTVDLRTATRASINTVFVQLMNDVGVEETMDLARELGVTTSVYQEGFHGLSVSLGAAEVSPLDMASAYGVFAARGERADPTPVLAVLDRDDNVLEENFEVEQRRRRVIKEVTADTMNDIMRGVFQRPGTAVGRGIGRPAAGKTGTSQDSGNAWFVGYTPTLSTAVWMGYRDSNKALRNIKGVRAVTGGSFPARTWQDFMTKALVNREAPDFNEPAPIEPVVNQARREARRGFDIGGRRTARATPDGGPYAEDLPPASVEAPTTTTSTTTTTTTTTPPGFLGRRPSTDDDP
ncbi:MAG TPA: transglycosylase domain-containing protein [Acidimicrobiales bacterium]|nr:transglycosylase domain-containing protein [Acidimicrobiales bacterium]